MFDRLRYALGDAARKRQIAVAEGGSGGGKHRKPKGGKHEASKTCGNTWTDKGIPGSRHANYPHETHTCGDEPHNRGICHCWGGESWKCNATTSK
jgi:hypothetical protein